MVVAGFTGRDAAAVSAHVAELAELGASAPDEIPAFWTVPGSLLLIAPTLIEVDSAETSGEGEPVLIRLPSGHDVRGRRSDHTHRELERESFEAAKLACPKLLGPSVWPFEDVSGHWDELMLSSHSGHGERPYQRATLAALREPADVLARLASSGFDPARPLVLFLGTVAVEDGFRFDSVFRASLEDPLRGRELVCDYGIREVVRRGAEPR